MLLAKLSTADVKSILIVGTKKLHFNQSALNLCDWKNFDFISLQSHNKNFFSFLFSLGISLMSSARLAFKTISNWLCWFPSGYVNSLWNFFGVMKYLASNFHLQKKSSFSFFKNKLQVKNIYDSPRKKSFKINFDGFCFRLCQFPLVLLIIHVIRSWKIDNTNRALFFSFCTKYGNKRTGVD